MSRLLSFIEWNGNEIDKLRSNFYSTEKCSNIFVLYISLRSNEWNVQFIHSMPVQLQSSELACMLEFAQAQHLASRNHVTLRGSYVCCAWVHCNFFCRLVCFVRNIIAIWRHIWAVKMSGVTTTSHYCTDYHSPHVNILQIEC